MTDARSHERPDVAAYWFGNWHLDKRMQEWFGAGFTEWELVRRATPRFNGHEQPMRPAWGYIDDADPVYMEKACTAAYEAGIDAFIVDWYWYDGPFLDRPLDEAILPSTSPLRFALMWANHDWRDVFPAPHAYPHRLLAPAAVDLDGFRTVTQRVIDRYLTSPRYWRIDGAAYFSFFEIDPLVRWLGGIEAARSAFDDFRLRASRAGVGELHLATCPSQFESGPAAHDHLAALGIDSVNDYNWSPSLGDGTVIDYREWRARAENDRDRIAESVDVPMAPNVSVGWDSTPRTPVGEPVRNEQWPYLPVVVDNTPQALEEALRTAAAWVADRPGPGYMTINAWNEWTEGSVLEPDEQWGTAKLDAVRMVFGREPKGGTQ
jgi:hypothetical protein